MDEASDLVAIADDLGEDGVRRVLHAAGASAALRAFDRDCQARFTLELLRRHAGTDLIRERLVARYAISERSAYRILAAALKSLPKSADFGSGRHDNERSNTEA